MSNINKIRLSGTTYDLEDLNAAKTVELTQAQYDALTVKDPNTFYVILDAQAADLSNYYTKTETDGLLDTKLDASAYTPTDLSNYYTKSETSGATQISTALAGKADTATTYTKTEVDTALGTKQATLVSGTNIKTVNNESLLGEGNIEIQGGGATYSAGTNISIDTANTISCTLPFRVDDSSKRAISLDSSSVASGYNSLAFGDTCRVSGANSFSVGSQTNASGFSSVAFGIKTTTNNIAQASFGNNNITNGNSDYFAGNSGNTLFSVGNGNTDSARHNAFEIRQNGDLYFADTDNTTYQNYYQKPMVRLQDMYGELGNKLETSAITTSITSASTDSQVPSAKAVYDALQESGGGTVDTQLDDTSENPVQNKVIYQKFDEVEEVTSAALNALNDKIGDINTLLEGI